MCGFEQVVVDATDMQYPNVPKVMNPVSPLEVNEALRKKTD
jgi:hypothetical protein